MLHYAMSRALADEHIHDMIAAAKQHELMSAARRDSTQVSASSSRLRGLTSRMIALVNGFGGARAPARTSTVTTTASSAGPIGCQA